ncbi:MAG: adenylate cyclase [Lachnospiraceae bacterium]|nr:adenylate cyclase [Lachnospiraceae bacterium]
MEIERKFIVEKIGVNLNTCEFKEVEQYYISYSPVIRIRKIGNKLMLTVKGKGHMAREEFEMELSEEEFGCLLKKAETGVVIKRRYYIDYNEYTIELDIYRERLSGLITAEVEFTSIEEAMRFSPPEWFSKEVTNDKRYKNAELSRNGKPYDK